MQMGQRLAGQPSWSLPLDLFMMLLGRIVAAPFETWGVFITLPYFYFICIGFVSETSVVLVA